MPIKLACPHCRTSFNLADQMAGKKVRCKSCQETFDIPKAEDLPLEPIDDQIQPIPAAGTPMMRRRFVPRPGDDDPDDDTPRSRRRRNDDEDEDESPRSRRRRDDEDEEDRSSRRRGRSKDRDGGGTNPVMIAGLAGLAVVLLVGVVGAVWMFLPRSGGNGNNGGAGGNNNLIQPPGGGGGEGGNGNGGGGGALAGVGKSLRYRWQGGPHVYSVRVEVEHDKYSDIQEGHCTIHSTKANPGAPVNPGERKGTGTGFVVDPNGYLVTCDHVVTDATNIEVALGGRKYPARVIARDATHDLALIQINANNLTPLPIANSDTAELGQEVRAFGFPLSTLLGDDLKVTRGTISGINKQKKVFQVDASINPGNSGGPLVSESGAVLGVNSAKLTGVAVSNVGFTTPSNEVKRLLDTNRVRYTNAGGGNKLDGTALVRQVKPSVALITVTLGPGAASENFNLRCASSLGKRQQPKPGVILMPGPPSFGGFAQPSTIQVDSIGHISQVNGGTQLPALLGEVGVFIVEPLPPDNRTTWETTGTCSITESRGGGFPFGPRFIGPRPPFGGPRFPGGQQESTRQARERSTYTLGATNGDLVTIQKQYQLIADKTATADGLNLSGTGTIVFDTKEGAPRSVEFRATLTVTSGNTTNRLPITVKYELITGDRRNQILNPPPPPKVEPKPPTETDLNKAIADLKSGNTQMIRSAADQLAKAKPTARRDEVAKALNKAVEDKDFWCRKSVLAALVVWGNAESVPALIPLLDDSNVFIRMDSMKALGQIKDERAAEPLAKKLIPFGDRGHAAGALKEIGSKAEKAVLPYLSHADWGVRMEACKILETIGTRASKQAVDKALQDQNGLVKMAAKKASEAIASRP